MQPSLRLLWALPVAVCAAWFAAAQSGTNSQPGFGGFDGDVEVLVIESEARNDANIQRTGTVRQEPPQERAVARVRALDKVTARLTALDMNVGEARRFGTLEIRVGSCLTNPPSQAPENRAYITIIDNPANSPARQIFAGWMFSSSPALNALEHPIYDVWIVECLTPDELAVVRTEDAQEVGSFGAQPPAPRPAQPERLGPSE